jgi:hypothetical protein
MQHQTVTVEPADALGGAILGLAVRGIEHPLLLAWLRTPNPTFGGRRPCDAWRQHPEIVEDIARLAVARNFRSGR